MKTSFFKKFSKLENARKPEVSLSPVGKGVSGASVLTPATVPNIRGGGVCATQLSKNLPCREKPGIRQVEVLVLPCQQQWHMERPAAAPGRSGYWAGRESASRSRACLGKHAHYCQCSDLHTNNYNPQFSWKLSFYFSDGGAQKGPRLVWSLTLS